MDEAVDISHPRFIQYLFCNILVNCQPTFPEDLYSKYKEPMSEDFVLSHSADALVSEDCREQLVINDILVNLCNNLKGYGQVNSDFDIPMPDTTLNRATLNTFMELDRDA